MARPTYSEMGTEVTRRLGNHSYSGFSSRVQRWLDAALYWATTAYHHPELDETVVTTLGEGASTVEVPSDIKIVLGIGLYDSSNQFVKWLLPRDFHVLQTTYDSVGGEPTYYARLGDVLHVDRASNQSYTVKIHSYKAIEAPDHTSGSSPLDPEWDEIVMGKATCLGYANLWRPDLAALHRRDLQILLDAVPNPPLNADLTADRSTRSKRDRTHRGVQS